MTDKKTQPDKKFYEDILGKRKRRVHNHPPKPVRSTGEGSNEASSSEPSASRGPYQGRDSSAPRQDDRSRGPYQGRDSSAPRQDDRTRPAVGSYGSDRPRQDDRSRGPGQGRGFDRPGSTERTGYQGKSFIAPEFGTPVFGSLPKETRDLLEAFPDIVQSVFPLDSKKQQALPQQIRDLSHELTDERSERRVGYMNEPATLSAYIRYFMWWNLVRLARLFVSLPIELSDGDVAADLGSGPLTLPIALWMARPDLRKKKISWYCVDISQGALAAGEELFLSLAARTGDAPWEIVRVRGECGVSLRRRVSLVASANMFNELFLENPQPIEAQAKYHAGDIASYASPSSSILVIEPGIPRAGRFISLLRDSFMRLGFAPIAPCPHDGVCPFPGLRNGKWCHFVFETTDAPAKLHSLSDEANLAKDRAALSFIFAKREKEKIGQDDDDVTQETGAEVVVDSPEVYKPQGTPLEVLGRLSEMFPSLSVRITSDPIRLPDFFTGRYGCSEMGMVMLSGTYQAADWLKECHSGSLVSVPRPDSRKLEYDSKTGAILIRLK